MSISSAAFELAYSVSPILLGGGVAANLPGGLLPISALLAPAALASGLLGGGTQSALNSFGEFVVTPGGKLISQQVGTYPFANQSVAANATIAQPLTVSVILIAPAQAGAGYLTKIAIMSALKATLSQHNSQGGTYMVATPAFLYGPGLLLDMTDVSGTDTKQVQYQWQFDFIFPLLTQAQATAAMNTQLGKISAQQQLTGDPPPISGIPGTQGLATSGVASGLVPSLPPVASPVVGGP